jgi:hypothetical protein
MQAKKLTSYDFDIESVLHVNAIILFESVF